MIHVGTAALGCPVEHQLDKLLQYKENGPAAQGQPRAAVPTFGRLHFP